MTQQHSEEEEIPGIYNAPVTLKEVLELSHFLEEQDELDGVQHLQHYPPLAAARPHHTAPRPPLAAPCPQHSSYLPNWEFLQ